MSEIAGLDWRALDRARTSRDPRFDGKFFIGVTSTGIYCRPICPVRSPKREHVRYFRTAAEAAEAGFRPCLRCRPEAAPGTPAWLGTSAVVRRGLRLIDSGFLDEAGVDALAAGLGIGARHLRRLFIAHVGASPVAVARTRRLHFAKRLLDDTNLPMTGIALAAGFGSVRRFNDAFRSTYGRSPRALRAARRPPVSASMGGDVALRLAFRPPYDWLQVRDFLATRAIGGLERVDESGYARTVRCDGGYALVQVQAVDNQNALELRVRGATPGLLFQLSATARRMFDLAADPERIMIAFKRDPLLAPLVRRRPGLRIPGVWDPFECAVRAVIGQQISVAAGRTIVARLVARLGQPVAGEMDGLTHLFPSAAAIASADLDGLGLPRSRIVALRALAAGVAGGLDLTGPAEDVIEALAALPGIGAWTAQYVALRALGEPDVLPAADLVLRRAASMNHEPLTARELEARAEAWRPWRSYATLHLWHAQGSRLKDTERE
jgi:AraC family transcriptional regulator, regulatory protein of adaptative response / DNA-3-methyladenine glycosylase II